MASATVRGVKEIIEKLEKEAGGIYKLATKCGVSHQTLTNWKKGPAEHRKLFNFLEWARKELKMSESAAYKKAIKKKVE